MPHHAGSPYRRGRFDLHGFRQRFRDRLTSRFGLRLHMTLILALVFAAAFLTTRVLFGLGVRSMGVRYLVASVTGYGAFLGLLRAWVWYVTSEAGAELEPEHSPDSVAYAIDPKAGPRSTPVPPAPRKKGAPLLDDEVRVRRETSNVSPSDLANLPSFGGSSSGSSGGGGGGLDLDDGIIAVLVIAIVAIVAAAVFGAAGYVIYQAPTVLGEAAFEVVLASVLARSSRKVTREGFAGSVIGATFVPALVVAALATVGGLVAQGICPGPSTMGGVVKQCVLEKKKT